MKPEVDAPILQCYYESSLKTIHRAGARDGGPISQPREYGQLR